MVLIKQDKIFWMVISTFQWMAVKRCANSSDVTLHWETAWIFQVLAYSNGDIIYERFNATLLKKELEMQNELSNENASLTT